MRTFARRRGIVTVGDLLARDPDEVAGQKNISWVTINAVRLLLERELGVRWESGAASRPPVDRRPEPEVVAAPSAAMVTPDTARDDLVEFWRRCVDGVSEPGATVLRYRSGLDGEARDFPWIAARLTVTVTTAERLEERALESVKIDPARFEALERCLRSSLRDGVCDVVALAAADPWFACVAEAPQVAEYVLRNLLGRPVSLGAYDAQVVTAERAKEPGPATPLAAANPPASPRVIADTEAFEMSLRQLSLTKRMTNFVEDLEIETVRDLLALDPRALIERKNVGRKTIRDVKDILFKLLGVRWNEPLHLAPPLDPPPPVAAPPRKAPRLSLEERRAARLTAHRSLVDFWRTAAQRLDAVSALVLAQRTGIDGPSKRFREIAEALGRSKQRVQQIEAGALRIIGEGGTLFDAIERRFLALLRGGARVVSDLVGDDPWFACFQEQPHFARFLLQHVFQVRVHWLTLDGVAVVATWYAAALHARWDPLLQALRTQRWPAPRAPLDALVREAAAPLGPVAEQIFLWRVAKHTVLDAKDPTIVLGFENKRHASIEAFLAEAPGPVRVAELIRRFGRKPLPRGAVYCDRGLVTLDRRLDGFDAFAARAVPACADWMRRHGPNRHWSCAELLDVAADLPGAPPWLGAWLLAAMCQRSEDVRYLGRLIVALPKSSAAHLTVRDTVVQVLTKAGRPIPLEDISARVGHRRALSSLTLGGVLRRPPFVEVAPDVWGLRSRDLPGGEGAAREAADAVAAVLEAQGVGLPASACRRIARASGPRCAAWTQEMVSSVLREDVRFRIARHDAVGLATWDDTRLPSRSAIVRRCLAEGGGRVAVAEVKAKIAAVHGTEPDVRALWSMAAASGARIKKGYMTACAPSNVARATDGT